MIKYFREKLYLFSLFDSLINSFLYIIFLLLFKRDHKFFFIVILTLFLNQSRIDNLISTHKSDIQD